MTTSETEYYPLTHQQKEIWYTEKVYQGTTIGTILSTMWLNDTNADSKLLEKAINICLEKNDACRLRIAEIEGEPKQYVAKYCYQEIDYYDFNGNLEDYRILLKKIKSEPFSIIDSNLYYFAIIKINNSEMVYINKGHHLISDNWSMITKNINKHRDLSKIKISGI